MPTKARDAAKTEHRTRRFDVVSDLSIFSLDGEKPKPQPAEYLSAKQVAALLCIREETARVLLRKGKLPGYRLGGGRWRISRREVEKLFSAEN
jgi:excisionase family DNA binding protein